MNTAHRLAHTDAAMPKETALPPCPTRFPAMRGAAAGLLLAATAASWAAPGVDEEAARALAKKSDCFKCHTVDQKKDGPAYREVAKKWRGKADAEAKLFTHVTTSPKVKIDGEEENHQMVKSKNEAEIQNLIRFILSLPNP
jgi:cytochrome c